MVRYPKLILVFVCKDIAFSAKHHNNYQQTFKSNAKKKKKSNALDYKQKDIIKFNLQ